MRLHLQVDLRAHRWRRRCSPRTSPRVEGGYSLGKQRAVDAGEGVPLPAVASQGFLRQRCRWRRWCRNERIAALSMTVAPESSEAAYPAEGFCVDIPCGWVRWRHPGASSRFRGASSCTMRGSVRALRRAVRICGSRGAYRLPGILPPGRRRPRRGWRVRAVEQVAVLVQRVVARARSAGPDGDPLQGGGAAEVDGFGL